MSLSGKVALVTGSSSGMGREIAKLFASQGASVAVLASRSIGKAQNVVDEIEGDGGKAKAFVCDVCESDAITTTVAAVANALGPIDILVNSAGIYLPTTPGSISDDVYDQMALVNLKAPTMFINAVAPAMAARGAGKIVNVISAAALIGIPSYSVYCALKAGLMMLTRSLALDLAPLGININGINPGNTETPMNEHLRTDPAHSVYLKAMEAATPSQRKFIPPREIAELALFLVSDKAKAMHGATLLMDEGIAAGM